MDAKLETRLRCGRSGITPRQARFAEEYIIDFDGRAAAERAGYSWKTVGDLLGSPVVQQRVKELVEARAARAALTADRVLEEVACLALSDMGEVLDFAGDSLALKKPSEIPERARRAIASVKVRRVVEEVPDPDEDGETKLQTVELTEFKMYDKGAALERLMKHLGLLQPNPELHLHGHKHEHQHVWKWGDLVITY